VSEPILQVRDLRVEYATPAGPAQAVGGVSFDLARRVPRHRRESGCGKSTLLFAVAQLLTYPGRLAGGEVLFDGVDFTTLKPEELRLHRWRDISVVMQSAMNALNPTLTIGAQLTDACKAHTNGATRRSRNARRGARHGCHRRGALEELPLPALGRMRQRAMIAMALLLEPKLVIMDEPTSALDVVAQRSLMHQVETLRHQLGFAVIFVTHDMSVVSHYSDRLAVMYAGEIVELVRRARSSTDRSTLLQGLMEAFPSLLGESKQLTGIAGNPPSLVDPRRDVSSRRAARTRTMSVAAFVPN